MAAEHSDYVHGSMPIDAQKKTYLDFVHGTEFGLALIIIILLFPILVFCVHMPWVPALAITFVVGLLLGPILKLGAGWNSALIGFAIICIGISLFITVIT